MKGLADSFLMLCILCFTQIVSAEQRAEQMFHASTLPYPPYQFINEQTGEPEGLAIDVINTLFQRTFKRKVGYHFYPWKRAVMLTKSGQSDLLFNAGKNDARQQWGRYINSVLILQRYNLFKLSGHLFSVDEAFENTKDLSIAVRAGYLYGSGEFRNALDHQHFKAVVSSESTAQSVQLLLHGRVDMFVGDYLPVQYYLQQQGLSGKIDVVTLNSEPMEVLRWPTYILLSKENTSEAMSQTLYDEMETMKQDGTYQSIVDRYRLPYE